MGEMKMTPDWNYIINLLKASSRQAKRYEQDSPRWATDLSLAAKSIKDWRATHKDTKLNEQGLEAAATEIRCTDLGIVPNAHEYIVNSKILAKKAVTAYLAHVNVDSGWQDISEAPKDGTHILAKTIGDGGCMVIYWREKQYEEPGWRINNPEEYDYHLDYYQPTHFQYLPTPPTTGDVR